MRYVITSAVLAFAIVLFTNRTASAQTARTGVGVGAEVTTTGIVGGTFVYDAGFLHVDALLGARFDDNVKTASVAGRLFFPVHRTQAADFSVGPGIGFVHADEAAGQDRRTIDQFHAEVAVQIRAFIVPNVAVSGSAGLGFIFPNAGGSTALFGGTVGGSFGITYFFF